MKRTTVLLLVLATTTVAFALKKDPAYRQARLKGAQAKMELHIADDGGNAVADVNVNVFMGMNFRDQGYWIRGRTDTNGVFNVAGKTCGDAIEIYLSQEGYYDSMKIFRFATMGAERDVKDGKWQPYGEEQRIQLRHIHNPIELTQGTLFADIATTNQWIGFDMMAKDFVRPFGKGDTADFEVRAVWDGKSPTESRLCYGELRFTHPVAGGCYVEKVSESSYPYVYCADRNGKYETSSLKVVNRMGEPGLTKIPFKENCVLVVRTRCVIDEETKVLKYANYGYIKDFRVSPSWKGQSTLRLFYVFNPTPNDTNLEPKQ